MPVCLPVFFPAALLHDIPSSSYRPPFLRYNVKVKGMEGNLEAVPHIDHLREIQPLVLEGLSYSKCPSLPASTFSMSQAFPCWRFCCSWSPSSMKKYRTSGPSASKAKCCTLLSLAQVRAGAGATPCRAMSKFPPPGQARCEHRLQTACLIWRAFLTFCAFKRRRDEVFYTNLCR